jgi:hypothetical protein
MEGTLQMIIHYFSPTQGHSTVNTPVGQAVNLPLLIAPKYQFLSHASNPYGFISDLT